MYQDYKDLLSAFHAHGVRYLIVGAYAVIFHAQPRFTKDIDLFIQADPTNAQATYAALAAFGAPLEAFDRKTSPNAAASFVSDATHTGSTFFLRFPASILTRPGSGAWRESSIPRAA
jgi:hypothetical protein